MVSFQSCSAYPCPNGHHKPGNGTCAKRSCDEDDCHTCCTAEACRKPEANVTAPEADATPAPEVDASADEQVNASAADQGDAAPADDQAESGDNVTQDQGDAAS